jgi:hypothetical protein
LRPARCALRRRLEVDRLLLDRGVKQRNAAEAREAAKETDGRCSVGPLVRRLAMWFEPRQPRWVARGRRFGQLTRKAQVPQDLLDHGAVLNGCNQAEATAAAGAGEDVDLEGTLLILHLPQWS